MKNMTTDSQQIRATKIHSWLLSRRFEPIWSLEEANRLLSMPNSDYKKEDIEWLMQWNSEIFVEQTIGSRMLIGS
jgi:hypothetical protein